MNKLISLFYAFCFLLLLVFGYQSYQLYQYKKIEPYLNVVNDSSLLDFCKRHYYHHDNALKSYMTEEYYPNGKYKEKLIEMEPMLPRPKDLFNPDSEKKIMKDIEELVPDNFDTFISFLIKERFQKNINSKKSLQKELAEYKKYGHGTPLTCERTRRTGTYWYLLSRYLDNKGDSQNSLLLSHGIFYLGREYERHNSYGLNAITKTYTYEITHEACKSELIWASKPRPDDVQLSKKLAIDIIELINSEFPCSEVLKNEEKEFEWNFENSSFKYKYSKYENIINEMKKSESYKELLNEVFQKPLKFIDRPLNVIRKELEDYNKTRDALFAKESDSQRNENLHKDHNRVIAQALLRNNLNDYVKMKISHEQKIAEMELTAIALVINSYASEYKQLPESMGKLSKWFGRALPINRFTQKPYVLDLKGKHLLYNNGADGIENLDSKNTDDIYFDFSFN